MLPGMHLGAGLRSGEGIGWLEADTIPNSRYRVPFFYLFLALCILLSFLLFVVFVLFLLCFALVGAL